MPTETGDMNPYEGLATVQRADGSELRVWAEVSIGEKSDGIDGAADRPPWTAQLTARGGEALLLGGDVTLIFDSGESWPAKVTGSHLSSGPHSSNWTQIKGTGPPLIRHA